MEKKVIDKIRSYYKLPIDVTDEQIANDLKGSLGEAFAKINFANQELKKAFTGGLPKALQKLFRR